MLDVTGDTVRIGTLGASRRGFIREALENRVPRVGAFSFSSSYNGLRIVRSHTLKRSNSFVLYLPQLSERLNMAPEEMIVAVRRKVHDYDRQ